jgi:hypothetical protein
LVTAPQAVSLQVVNGAAFQHGTVNSDCVETSPLATHAESDGAEEAGAPGALQLKVNVTEQPAGVQVAGADCAQLPGAITYSPAPHPVSRPCCAKIDAPHAALAGWVTVTSTS